MFILKFDEQTTQGLFAREMFFLPSEQETALLMGRELLTVPSCRNVRLLDFRTGKVRKRLVVLAKYYPDYSHFWTARVVGQAFLSLPKCILVPLEGSKPSKKGRKTVPIATEKAFEAPKAPRRRVSKRERAFGLVNAD